MAGSFCVAMHIEEAPVARPLILRPIQLPNPRYSHINM